MLTNEKKKELLEKYLPIIYETQDDTAFYVKLRELLMIETKNGRLYKYRTFDRKGWSLENLKNRTIHCSSPSSFNDPFECTLGVDYNSIFCDMFEDDFDIVGNLLISAVNVINKEKELADFDADEQPIIKALIESEFSYFYKKYCTSEYTDDEIMHQFEKSNVIGVVMEIIAKNSKYGEQLRTATQMLSNIEMKNVMYASNEATFADFAKSQGIIDDVDEMELTRLLYLKSHPEKSNEVQDTQSRFEDIGRNINKTITSLFNIGCLCTDYKNRLMWSHYADSHKGFCIEYDYSSYGNKDNEILPFPVVYSTKRVKVPWKPAFDYSPENLDKATSKLAMALLTKDSAWKYENEWRILVNPQDSQEVKSAPVSCIYLGVLCSEKNKRKILRIAKELNVPVKQMVVDRGEYELHTRDII